MSSVGSILTNTGALDALQSISNTSTENNTLENEMSTGLAISSPSDNPAGYITAQGFTSQLNGITQAISNANQGVSLLQTATGALQQQIGVVQQLNSTAVQAANGTETSAEANSLQSVVGQLLGQVTSIASQTQFNNVNLLDGSFTNKQFQVGANEGQTMNLSIGNTSATQIGMYALGTSSGAGKVGTGAFSASTVTITGPAGGQATVAVASATESAAVVASDVNAVSGTTGVAAEATNTATFTVSASTGDDINFTLQAGSGAGGTSASIGSSIAVNATSVAEAVSQINQQSSTTGIVASDSSGNLTLTQTSGQNIGFTNLGTGTTVAETGTTTTTVTSGMILQGQVQLQSSAAFSVSGGSNIGVTGTASLDSLAAINVTTAAGANQAINVVKYALQSLNNTGGQLGAVQQGLTANINNLNTTSQNVTSALGTVQDANLPAVANQLTQAQIQAQAGVAALKSSTTLQQSYLSLLP